MARLLVRALGLSGHTVEIASRLRSFANDPAGSNHVDVSDAQAEIERLTTVWNAQQPPDLWFCYHPYYKAPDRIGPFLSRAFGIPYVTAEASYAQRRSVGAWSSAQDQVVRAVEQAALNICFTHRDRDGLSRLVQPGRLAMLAPFIDTAPFQPREARAGPPRLVTVAMMRQGEKLASYGMLGEALQSCRDVGWRLAVVGDGACREQVEAAFSGLGQGRVDWLGEKRPDEIPAILAASDLMVWPGFGEAYGLAYLEAQAAGLPVVAQDTAGVPEVVRHGVTGLLTPPGDVRAYADAVVALISDAERRAAMGAAARRFVLEERSLDGAAARLGVLLGSLAP